MAVKSPLHFTDPSRVYYVICKMRPHSDDPRHRVAYAALKIEWDKFMALPDDVPGLDLSPEVFHGLRQLESEISNDFFGKPAIGSVATMGITIAHHVDEHSPATGTRRARGYWQKEMHTIRRRKDAGEKVEALAVEYRATPQMIYNAITMAKRTTQHETA